MKTNWTQKRCDLENALRDFERKHAIWMSLSVFTPEGRQAKLDKDAAGIVYDQARAAWENENANLCHA